MTMATTRRIVQSALRFCRPAKFHYGFSRDYISRLHLSYKDMFVYSTKELVGQISNKSEDVVAASAAP